MEKKIRLTTAVLILLAGVALTMVFAVYRLRAVEKEYGLDAYGTEAKLIEAVQVLRAYYVGELDEAELTDAAIAAMVDSLNDRWSYYLPAAEMSAYRDSQNNQYGGLGIVVANDADGVASILRVYQQSPAGEAGIVAGSSFLTVAGQDAFGLDTDSVVALMKEQIAAGLVEITLILPDGFTADYQLVPGEVLTEPVSFELLDSGIGYIRIENFEARCAAMAIEAVESLQAQQASALIFDVRENPGGQLSELLRLLDYLLPEGTLFISRWADGTESVDTSDAACVFMPMAVLVDEDSYSAAEFFAAALQEYDWATVVGKRTTGKGRAQVTVLLYDDSAIHVSNISYYTPKGRSLTDVGITPEVEAELALTLRAALYYGTLEHGEDSQLLAAESLLLESAGVS